MNRVEPEGRRDLSTVKKLAFSAVFLVGLVVLAEVALAVLPWQRLLARDHVPDAESEVVLLAVGDSVTYGDGLAPSAAYPAQLRSALHQRGLKHIDVVNLGEQGKDSHHAALSVKMGMDSLSSDVKPVVLWLVGHNDFLQYAWKELGTVTPVRRKPFDPRLLPTGESEGRENWVPRSARILFWGMGAAVDEVPSSHLGEAPSALYRRKFEHAVHATRQRRGHLVALTYLVPGEPEGSGLAAESVESYRAIRELDLALNQFVRELAAEYQVPLIDLPAHVDVGSRFDEGWFLDPIHPTAKGQAEMARAVRESLVMEGLLPQEAF